MPKLTDGYRRQVRRDGCGRKIDWPGVLLDACRRLELGENSKTLCELGDEVGVSPFELHRQFKRRLGTTPKNYARALKLFQLARCVALERSTLEAAFASGFQSSAAAYAMAGEAFGISPGKLRGDLKIGWWMGLSDLGWMLMAATYRGICWLAFGDEPDVMLQDLNLAFPKARFYRDEIRLFDWFDAVREWVLLPHAALDFPVDVQGTAFQARVWRALRHLPLGKTVSYGELAREIGAPEASRAVASACARNKVALLIPCHRVVRVGGCLADYRWGLERKARILRREYGTHPVLNESEEP